MRKSSLTEHGALGKQRIGIWTGLLTLPLPSSFPLLPQSHSTACVVTYRLPRLLPLTSTLSRLTAHPAPRHLQPHPEGSRRLSRGPKFYRPLISRHSFMNALIIAPTRMVLTARCRSSAHMRCRAERFERDRGIDDMGLGHRVLGYFFPGVGGDMPVLLLRKSGFAC